MLQAVLRDVETVQQFINHDLPAEYLESHKIDEFTAATDRVVAYCDWRNVPFQVEALLNFKEMVLEGARGSIASGETWNLTPKDRKVARTVDQLCNRIKGWLGGESKGTGAPREGGGVGQCKGSRVPSGDLDPDEREKQISKLPRAVRRAYRSYELAASKAGKDLNSLTDREALILLKEVDFRDDKDAHRELDGYKPPTLANWSRYLTKARKALGEQKYIPRRGRPHGKSIVRQNQIEQPERGE
jgi:hypothetical protein